VNTFQSDAREAAEKYASNCGFGCCRDDRSAMAFKDGAEWGSRRMIEFLKGHYAWTGTPGEMADYLERILESKE
jgi:hypothetical protein